MGHLMLDVRGAEMRTTLTLDDDLLEIARQMAEAQSKTIGKVVSSLLRKALTPPSIPPSYRNGILLVPRHEGAPPSTLEMIKRLDEEMR